jgi:hypothetical protein
MGFGISFIENAKGWEKQLLEVIYRRDKDS